MCIGSLSVTHNTVDTAIHTVTKSCFWCAHVPLSEKCGVDSIVEDYRFACLRNAHAIWEGIGLHDD